MSKKTTDKIDQEIENSLKRSYSDKNAPDHLWQRIQDTVESQNASGQLHQSAARSSWVPLSIAASGLLVAVALLVYSFSFRQLENTTLVEALVGEHDTFVASGRDLDINSSDINTLNNWFDQRIDAPLLPSAPVISDVKLAGGRLCQIKGMRIASYAYQYNGKTVSLYLTKLDDKPGSYAVTVEIPPDVEIAKHDNGTHASWKNDGWQYFLVGNIPEEKFKEISNSLSSQSTHQKS